MLQLLKFKKISKNYCMPNYTVKALTDIDLEIENGEFVSLSGPSGCGKSTLMNIAGCLDVPTGGEYYFNGDDISGLGNKKLAKIRNKQIGFIFQAFNLINTMSVLENVALPGLYSNLGRKESLRKARIALEKVELGDRIDHLPTELSGGQQQRVAIARAIFGTPELLLADEPTGNLDSKTSKEILKVLSGLNKNGMTIILVTHDATIAEMTHRQIKMMDGKIL